jgi:hypothetical protein
MLPRQLPPTFHGSAVRFSYSVTVTYGAEFAPEATAADVSPLDTPSEAALQSGQLQSGMGALDITRETDAEQLGTSDLPQSTAGHAVFADARPRTSAAAAAAEVLQNGMACSPADVTTVAVEADSHSGGAAAAVDVAGSRPAAVVPDFQALQNHNVCLSCCCDCYSNARV